MPDMNENEEFVHMPVPVAREGLPTPRDLADSLHISLSIVESLMELTRQNDPDAQQLLTYIIYQHNQKETHL
jgi:hypothetical protein